MSAPDRAPTVAPERVPGIWSSYLVQPVVPPEAAEDERARAVLAHSAIRFIIASGRIDATAQREMGRAVGRQAGNGEVSVQAAIGALPAWGVGHLDHEEKSPGRHVFRSRDLALARASKSPSCALVLGFAEGIVQGMTDEPTLGTEVSCRATGAPECVFVVSARLHS